MTLNLFGNRLDPEQERARLLEAAAKAHEDLSAESRIAVELALARMEQRPEEFLSGCAVEERELYEVDYMRQPEGVRRFIFDPQYLGKIWKNNIFGPLVDDLEEFLEGPYTVALLAGGIGWGKCFGINTMVLMYDGTAKPVQDIEVGDVVMGADSTPRRVIRTTRGRAPLYLVTPVKGQSYVVNEHHELALEWTPSSRGRHVGKGGRFCVEVQEFLQWPAWERKQAKGYRVGVEFAPHGDSLPFDPYLLGLWLGDGTSMPSTLQFTFTAAHKPELCAYIRQVAAANQLQANHVGGDKSCWNLTARSDENQLLRSLSSLGVCGNKHIPHRYLTGSRPERLQLLAGLLDTDGELRVNRGIAFAGYRYSTVLPELAAQVVFLARSLGLAAYAHEKTKTCQTGATALAHEVEISGAIEEIPVKLVRKCAPARRQKKNVLRVGIKSIEPIGEGEYYGFSLDHDQLFLLDDFTVTHNTTFADIGILYDVYQVSCLRDPARTFGMRTGSNIAFINVATTLKQARKVLFGGLASMLQQSPYFQQVFPFDKKIKSELRFPRHVLAYPATASPEGVLGEGIFSAAIDEANFMELVERSKRSVPGDTGLYDQAEQTFNKLEFRITSRMNKKGRVPGHIYVISSARYPGDFTERMEQKAATPEGQHIFVRHYPAWGTRPKSVYLGGTFKVEVGDTTRRSRVLGGNEENVNWERVIEVPKDFEPKFRADTEWAVRDFAGISTLSLKPFIVKREAIQRMFDQGLEHGLKHPFWPQEGAGLPLPVTLQHPDPHVEYLIPENLHWVERQKKNALDCPMFEDGVPVMEKVLCSVLYHAHIDLSQTHCSTGLCVTHMVGTKMCERVQLVGNELVTSYEEKPIIWVDLVLEIKAPPQGEIDIPKVRAVLYNLAQLGMQFGSVTFDTYGSQETLKTLKDKGYPAEEFSLDRTKEGYEQLKEAIYDERIWCYPHPLLQRELGQLEDLGKKIDHPSFPGASRTWPTRWRGRCMAARRGGGAEKWLVGCLRSASSSVRVTCRRRW